MKSINKAIELAKNKRDSKLKSKWNVLYEDILRKNSSIENHDVQVENLYYNGEEKL